MNTIHFRLIVAALSLGLMACATETGAFPGLKPATERTAAAEDSGGDRDRSVAYSAYLQAILAERAGDYASAIKYYERAANSDDSSSQALRQGAGLYLRIGDVKSAQNMARKCVEINKDSTGCLDILAGISSSMGATAEAEEYLKRLIALSPDDISPVVALAVTYIQNSAPQKAIDALKKGPASQPHQFVYDKYFMGRAYLELGDYKNAVTQFEEIFSRRPDFMVAFENLSWTYRMLGQWDKAIDMYQKYLALSSTDEKAQALLEKTVNEKESRKPVRELREEILKDKPEEINYRFFLGMTKWQQGEILRDMSLFHEALAQFQLVRAADPSSQQVISYIASIFESIGLLKEAVSAWKQISPSSDDEKKSVNLKIADLYDRLGDFNNSLKHAKVAQDLDPEDPELKFLTGFMYGKLQKSDEAVREFTLALEQNPNNPKYYFHLGVTYEKLKKYDKCIESMKQAIALKPDHSNALNYLGYIYAEQDINLDEAERYLLQALELEPNNGYFIDSLGWIYFKKKKYDDALEQLLIAVRNITPDPTVLEHLGDVYSALDRMEDAANSYQRALDAKVYDDRVIDRETTRNKLKKVEKAIKAKSKKK